MIIDGKQIKVVDATTDTTAEPSPIYAKVAAKDWNFIMIYQWMYLFQMNRNRVIKLSSFDGSWMNLNQTLKLIFELVHME